MKTITGKWSLFCKMRMKQDSPGVTSKITHQERMETEIGIYNDNEFRFYIQPHPAGPLPRIFNPSTEGAET